MRMRALVTTTALVIALAGCGSDPDIATNGAEAPQAVEAAPGGVDLSTAAFVDQTGEAEPEVDALDNVFKAKFIEVKAGTTVTFRNDGRNTHNLLPADDGEFTGIEAEAFEPGTEATVTFAEPGDYPYYCSLHGTTTKGMVGAVRVMK